MRSSASFLAVATLFRKYEDMPEIERKALDMAKGKKEINGIKKFSQGDYAESELVRVCDNMQIRSQVVQTYLEFAKDKKGIVYTVNKAHNYTLALQFNRNGVPTIAIDSDTPKEQRER